MAKSQTHHTVGVRVPNALYAKMAKRAEAEHRSLSNLIVKKLSEVFDDDGPRTNGVHHKTAKPQAAV